MDKKQNQIEETVRSCTDCMHYEICSLWTTTDLDEDKAYKYCFGRYRPKIPENAVVLTREEYDQFSRRNFIIAMLKDCIKDARKETAEKIVNNISSDIMVINTKEYGNIEVISVERLQEICNGIIDGE